MAAERGRLPLSSLFRNFWLTLALGASVSACVGAANPVTGQRDWTAVDEREELEMGHETHQAMLALYGYYDDPRLQEYVAKVGWTLVPHSDRPELEYRFTVLDSPVVNAFATPGYVYITRGMLALLNSEAELAGILGHELAHITARHSARQVGQRKVVEIAKLILDEVVDSSLVNSVVHVLGEAHLKGYGRENELEADRLGARYAALAGYDPDAMLEVIRILKDQETHEVRMAARERREPWVYHGIFSTHPDNDTRLQEVIREASRHRVGSEALVRRAEYLRHIEGMAFGPAEAEGTLRGRCFYHRVYGFTMVFPEGWKTRNLQDRLVAEPPGRGLKMRVTLRERQESESACDFLVRNFEKSGRVRPRATDGFAGCQAWVWDGESESVANALVLEISPGVFLVAGARADRMDELRRHAQAVENTFQSLRPLTKDEYEAARPPEIHVVEAKAGDTYAAYAAGADWDPDPESQLRLFNADYPTGEPIAGESVKTVR